MTHYTPAHAIRIVRLGYTPTGEKFTDVYDEVKETGSRLHGHIYPLGAAHELAWYREKTA